MAILNFVNANITKYLYLVLIVVLLVFLIKLLLELKPTANIINAINGKVNSIKEEINNINTKIEKIEYTKKHSIPMFIDAFFISLILGVSYKDYKNTKLARRSIAKSTIKGYRRVHDRLGFNATKPIKRFVTSALRFILPF